MTPTHPLPLLAILALAACGGGAPAATTPTAALPEGNLLPEEIETIVFGSTSGCRDDADCASRICYYGACGGLLTVDTRWMQDTIADTLAQLADQRPQLDAGAGQGDKAQVLAPGNQVGNNEGVLTVARAAAVVG